MRKQTKKYVNRRRSLNAKKFGVKNGVLANHDLDFGGRPCPETDYRTKKPRHKEQWEMDE